jgi:hypothetical protein
VDQRPSYGWKNNVSDVIGKGSLRSCGLSHITLVMSLVRGAYGHAAYRMMPQPSMLSRIAETCSRDWNWGLRMSSSGMLRRVALVRTDAFEELNASIIRVIRIGELGTTLAV